LPTPLLLDIAEMMEAFEAAPSRANTGAGRRREGAVFESVARQFWDGLGDHLGSLGATTELTPYDRFRRFRSEGRTLYLPSGRVAGTAAASPNERRRSWLSLKFDTADLVDRYPGTGEAIRRWAPTDGEYAGDSYPQMYGGRRTTFDDTVVLEDEGVLVEKVLVEYKTAKSIGGKGVALEGNAHERLSFQALQYLEVATKYPSCSFLVFANGAFARYKNKYHVSFRVQAERLSVFSWFKMDHCCGVHEYARAAQRLIDWVSAGSRA